MEQRSSIRSGLLTPLVRLAAVPVVLAASAVYWVVAARIIERRFGLGHIPSRMSVS
jgi:hypothetical protein